MCGFRCAANRRHATASPNRRHQCVWPLSKLFSPSYVYQHLKLPGADARPVRAWTFPLPVRGIRVTAPRSRQRTKFSPPPRKAPRRRPSASKLLNPLIFFANCVRTRGGKPPNLYRVKSTSQLLRACATGCTGRCAGAQTTCGRRAASSIADQSRTASAHTEKVAQGETLAARDRQPTSRPHARLVRPSATSTASRCQASQFYTRPA